MKPTTIAAAVTAAAIGLAAGTVSSFAFVKRPPTSYPDDYVVAESKFGNGTVSGPVRQTSKGWQVQTPGGNWLYCQRSCSETLRVETIDFWQKQQGLTHECGIFGCLEVRR